jgi:photosystem II stability/assembly factor-like uncharacterized protein
VAVGDEGTSVSSADGGHNFTTVSGGLDGRFTLVRANSATTAFAAGRDGTLARTTDGGHDWDALTPPGAGDLIDVSFPTDATGFALAPRNVLTRTDDVGRSWRLLDVGTFLHARGVVAVDPDHLVLVMDRGLRRSADAGLDFVRVRQREIATAAFTGGGSAPGVLYAYGRRVLAISRDRGAHWTALALPPHRVLSSVDFVDATTAFALTRDGRVWRRTRNGAWRELTALGTELGTALSFATASDGYVSVPAFGAASGGYVMRTTDGGVTWRPQLVDSKPIRPGGLTAPAAGSAFALSGADHLLATDRGGDLGERTTLTLSIPRLRPGVPGIIAINGKLSPADGGETVVVSKREGRSRRWGYREVTVSSSGRFSVFTKVTKTTAFVAQWSGDDEHVGAGTPVVTVGIGAKYVR